MGPKFPIIRTNQAVERVFAQFRERLLPNCPVIRQLAGNLDILKTHFADDTSVLYRNNDKGMFDDVTTQSGLAVETRYISWGVGMVELDDDGLPDFFIVTGGVYPEIDAFWDDLADVYAQEIARLAELGCTYLQLDDTSFAYLNDPRHRAVFDERGESGSDQHLTYIRTINRALANRPAGMTVTVHMCRGNFRSSWVAQGGYDFVADALFNQLTVDGYFMEFDDERSGGFAPLRFVPKGKYVVLGLVTSKKGELEAKDDIKRRIEEASKFVDIDQLCLSPQCGFSSTLDGNSLSRDEQIAKLRLVAETAEEVWGTQ